MFIIVDRKLYTSNMAYYTLVGFVMTVTLAVCYGYPNGAPAGACNQMMPQHGVSPQQSTPPYDIKISSYQYCPNVPITVTLVGAPYGETFKGFLCQPRTDEGDYGTVVGTFTYDQQTLQNNCDKTGLTHKSNDIKKSVEFKWNPGSTTANTVYIVCTIVKEKTTLWTRVSSSLSYAGQDRCVNPGVLPTTCSSDNTCDSAVGMSICVNGKCECPADMTITNPTDTYCSPKKLGDSCSATSDCGMIADTVCDMGTCKCEPGFKHNTTSGPCYPKVLHDSCMVDNECRMVNHSKCIDSKCQCPREGFIEVGNATIRNCSATNLPSGCTNNEECNRVVSKSICMLTGTDAGLCRCPADLVLLKPMDRMCSTPPTDSAITTTLSTVMLIGSLLATIFLM